MDALDAHVAAYFTLIRALLDKPRFAITFADYLHTRSGGDKTKLNDRNFVLNELNLYFKEMIGSTTVPRM